MTEQLCTIIHISDLHFGGEFFNRPSRIKDLGRGTVAAHSYAAAEALAYEVNVQILLRTEAKIPVVVVDTGDVGLGPEPGAQVQQVLYRSFQTCSRTTS